MATSGPRGKPIDWSVQGKVRVWLLAVLGTLACILIALAVDYSSFSVLEEAGRNRAILVNIFLPMSLAGPAIFLLSSKIRQLAIVQAQLTVLASTDSLTTVLNRGAFTTLVDAYLKEAKAHDNDVRGALLVVDADHFKKVNDRYGHDQGDVALRIIADAIKSVLRGADIVGRIGGEEFGVFLPGAEGVQPEALAERIRIAVEAADFRPNGERSPLSVSVGGATFRSRISFTDLFRAADQRLYAAKAAGRNRVHIAAAGLLSAAA